jgi:hypothetical protein
MAKQLFHSWRALRGVARAAKDASTTEASELEKGALKENMPETQSSDGTDMSEVSQLRQTILEHLISTTGKDRSAASSRDWYIATALVVRDRIIQSWIPSKKSAYDSDRASFDGRAEQSRADRANPRSAGGP